MEKYGVEVDDDKVKTGSAGNKCPSCGADVRTDLSVPMCPNCGTKPFEKQVK
jgi:predicted RNA-binding Zn-ribbon protein involved in translation (DUF1610 family)